MSLAPPSSSSIRSPGAIVRRIKNKYLSMPVLRDKKSGPMSPASPPHFLALRNTQTQLGSPATTTATQVTSLTGSPMIDMLTMPAGLDDRDQELYTELLHDPPSTSKLSSMIQDGANVSTQELCCGYTALHWAAVLGDKSLTNLLISKGADPNVTNKMGRTALHLACESNQPKIVSSLIQAGADVHKQTLSGWTPLHFAAVNNCVQVVDVLLRKSSKVIFTDVTTDSNHTASQLTSSPKIKQMIKEYYTKTIAKPQKSCHKESHFFGLFKRKAPTASHTHMPQAV